MIPTGGHRRVIHGAVLTLVANCVASVVRRSTYPNYEIVCVVDTGTDDDAVAELVAAGGDKLRLIPYEQPFNFARKINLGVLHAQNDFLLLLNDDIEVISPDWIESLLMFALEPAVGAVGASSVCGSPPPARRCSRRRRKRRAPYYGFPADFDGHMDNATPRTALR